MTGSWYNLNRKQERGEIMKTITLKVEGMMCGHCEQRVNNALSQIDGIASVHASAQENQVTCEYDETKVNETNIKETIEDVGYDVV